MSSSCLSQANVRMVVLLVGRLGKLRPAVSRRSWFDSRAILKSADGIPAV